MKKHQVKILHILQNLKGSGKFASIQSADFLLPGLEVQGLGEIAFPVNRLQAEALIQVAHKAPFGKGRKTIVDTSVRSVWEIDAARLTFNNPGWDNFLKGAIKKIKSDLGLENYTIAASLYKLLIYEKGDFFLSHKDSEKEKGMFGTLIINLPSKHTGGELEINFEGKQVVANFAEADTHHAIKYAAFYADCDHEVKPLTSGYRVSLVYNLIQRRAGNPIEIQSLQAQAEELASIFSENENDTDPRPGFILLGHQYTPGNFSKEALKLNDRAKAEVIIQAAKMGGNYAKLCLVTSYVIGLPAYDGYQHSNKKEAEMDEVFDEILSIEHWAADHLPGFDNISFEEDELIRSFPLNEGKPQEKENTGYMGNYGPELMYWYHYGAVMVWTPRQNAEILLAQNTETQLEWIAHFAKVKKISYEELEAVGYILSSDLNDANKSANFNAVINWLIVQKSQHFLLEISRERLQFFFERIDAAHWTLLFKDAPASFTKKIFDQVTQHLTLPVLEKTIGLIKTFSEEKVVKRFSRNLMAELPGYLKTIADTGQQNIGKEALEDLFWIAAHLSTTPDWNQAAASSLTASMQRQYAIKVLIPQLLAVKTHSDLTSKLLGFGLGFMQDLASNKPQPPADWTRKLPDTTRDKDQWKILKEFMASPDERVFEFRRNQHERKALEYAIKRADVDLTFQTIKTGSPHILRIIKTESSYLHALKEWEKDVKMLGRLEKKGK